MTRWRLRIECWIAQAANTQYVIGIAFPLEHTATMVARTRLNVTLFVRCLCCFCITAPLRVQFFFFIRYDCTVFLRYRHGVILGQRNYRNVRSEHKALESVFALVPCTSR